ncbi:hypothetical protein FVC29_03125 [Salmonella enterica]|nr:hypothetical protein [Salmonella enterica]
MYYVDNNSGSPTMPALSPAQSNIPTWFTEGDKNKGISWIGQDWLNILQAELLNILSEAGIKPDKGKLNQLTLSIKAIITTSAYTQANNLKEIFDAGVAAQAAARSHLGLGKLATKDSLGPTDVNALAKDQNLNDVPDKAKARTALQLGNSATRNVGTTANTVAAGDDARIIATKKAIDDTQTGLAAQGVMWLSTADDLSNLPSGARRFASNKAPATVLPAAGYFFIEVLAKRDTANGSCILATSDKRDVWIGTRYTVPDEAGFTWVQLNQNVQNLGLTEAVNKALNAVQKTGDTMTGNLFLKNDGRMHFAILNEDGNARMWLYKDKGGDGIRINNGVDGGGDFVFGKNGEFYSPSHVHAGGAMLANNGDVYGGVWGNQWISTWANNCFAARDANTNTRATWDWVNQNFITNIRFSAERQVGASGIYTYHENTVLTGFNNHDADYSAESLFWSEIQILKNGQWLTVGR